MSRFPFSRYGTPQQYRAKLEYDQAFRKALAFNRYSDAELDADPKLRREHNTAWAEAEKAEQKLTWWQTRAID